MEQPYFALMDLVGNSIKVPHYRSVMLFSRWARQEVRETETVTGLSRENERDDNQG